MSAPRQPVPDAVIFDDLTAPTAAAVSVREFNARGDDLTDDTAAIQRAMDHVRRTGGGVLSFPPGTYLIDPSAARLIVGSNLTLEGCGDSTVIKVKDGVGDCGDIFSSGIAGFEGTLIENFRVHRIKFDSNADNRPGLVVGNDAAEDTQTWFHFQQCSNVVFFDCTFFWNGHQAIKVTNEYQHDEDRRGFSVTGCRFYYHRAADQGFYDNTAIYSQQKHTTISGNHFWTDAYTDLSGVIAGLIAVEVHHGPFTVTGNTVEWFYSGVYANSANTFTGSEQPFTGNVVSGNTITHCNVGIELWAMPGKINQAVSVANNTITVANLDWAKGTSAGIKIPAGADANGDHDQISITDNVIRFQNEPDNRANVAEEENGGIAICPLGSLRGLLISGNQIYNAPGCGISIRPAADSVGSNTLKDIFVIGNLIVNAGQNGGISNTYRCAIRLRYRISHAYVLGNIVVDHNNPFRGYGDFLIKDITAPVVGRFNQVTNDSGAYVSDISGTADWPAYQDVSPAGSPTFVAATVAALTILKTTGTARLTVRGASNAQDSEVHLTEDGSSGATLRWSATGNALEFWTGTGGPGGTKRLSIDRDSGVVTLANGLIVSASSTPASATAAGVAGTITWDASYIYVCTATNTWVRSALATW